LQWQDPTTKCVGKEKLVERQIGFSTETTLYLQQPGEKLKKAKKVLSHVSIINFENDTFILYTNTIIGLRGIF
jgi:hypothetical protein